MKSATNERTETNDPYFASSLCKVIHTIFVSLIGSDYMTSTCEIGMLVKDFTLACRSFGREARVIQKVNVSEIRTTNIRIHMRNINF